MSNLMNANTEKKKKGGRPRLILEERRAYSVRPGFTEHEFASLEERAERAGLDLSEFIRRLSLNQQFYAVPTINRQALIQLSKIGSLLNQIAKVANSTQNFSATESIDTAKNELEKITLALTLSNESD